MRIVAILQARVGSMRLPAKVLRDLCGRAMLVQQLRRVRAAKTLDAIVVATTDRPEDDAVAALAADCGIAGFRGDARDVLDRFYRAATAAGADIVVRLTGDCPLHDPEVIDETVRHFLETGFDYVANAPCHPDGCDTEVFSFAALARAWREARLPSEREHVTPYIRNRPELFRSDAGRIGESAQLPLHWSVDTEADFRFVEAVYRELYREGEIFHVRDVLALLARRPELAELNPGADAYEGYRRSLQADAAFIRGDRADREPVTVRRAADDDARDLWLWRSDAETQAMSRNARPIAWDGHLAWYRARLRDRRTLILIGRCGRAPVGMVRFELMSSGVAEIGIVVAPECRGRGIGGSLLPEACRFAREAGFATTFEAAIKPANIASQRIFAAAGFRPLASDEALLRYRCEPPG